jgi:hypothetical protein
MGEKDMVALLQGLHEVEHAGPELRHRLSTRCAETVECRQPVTDLTRAVVPRLSLERPEVQLAKPAISDVLAGGEGGGLRGPDQI